jgi:predicted O-linked N-acetylglucosamine transferase (SPINDLY family)
MLTSLGASELITHDLEAYQALALKLAGDAKELQRVGDLVRENAKTSALFNTEASVRSLEKAYQRVWEDFAGGIGPRSVHI